MNGWNNRASWIGGIALALLPCLAGEALGESLDRLIQPADPIFGTQLGADDFDEPEIAPPSPSPPAAPETVEAWERAVVGKPVHGYRTGRLGVVASLATNGRGQPAAIVVRLDPEIDSDQANVPVLWTWVRGQIGAATLVLPWSATQVQWLLRKPAE